MAVPNEYNITGKLMGLGPNVLLEVLSQMKLVFDTQQFLGVNKKTFALKEHQRFGKIIESLNYSFDIMNPEYKEVTSEENFDGKVIIRKNFQGETSNCISQDLENGIWVIEAEFKNLHLERQYSIPTLGIVDASYNFPKSSDPSVSPQIQHNARFRSDGFVVCKGRNQYGNQRFDDNKLIKLELDCGKGTLTLFIDGVQQPIIISGIKEKVHFFDSYCTVHSLKRLTTPSGEHTSQEITLDWNYVQPVSYLPGWGYPMGREVIIRRRRR
ncbi:MAG: hypothetical protein EZS28_015111 [Streblomastix strix]|uniref:SPRY domain-containing protein n=1 Tax=Streblomastix strix TaxID=222440 RepID=A0A5J4W3E7_9EUKA|nr:MAG: hypothetical protein EZS28_015111 [Streblomastix strix]